MVCGLVHSVHAQPATSGNSKAPNAFQWVNPIPAGQQHPRLKHATFRSPSLGTDVGYCIYLPAQYNEKKSAEKRFPVVYYLHGGRPGSETKSIGLVKLIDEHISSGEVEPMIYVFVNGGPVSHYNMPDRPDAQGEDVFVKELIPHIDATYRTIARREGRGIEGFSQGGRGTTRIMFKHPELFVSASPGGGGYATEKKISENDGYESENLRFAPGDNVWDLSRKYAKNQKPPLNILVHVGTKCFNYENNLEFMASLEELKIPFERLIVADAPHSAKIIYEKQGLEIMTFHARNFSQSN
ncbi:MAG: 1,4-beta-xylanase [Planctomycetaceae bacterium]|nr:1,4-beta-xylanase [Planctomycetaceae bacterium]